MNLEEIKDKWIKMGLISSEGEIPKPRRQHIKWSGGGVVFNADTTFVTSDTTHFTADYR